MKKFIDRLTNLIGFAPANNKHNKTLIEGYKYVLKIANEMYENPEQSNLFWIPIESKMPKTLQTVYVIVENEVETKPKVKTSQFQTMAQYVPYLTVPEEDFMADEHQGDGDYNEETDTYYAPEGWYEYQLETEIHYILTGKVTHWMPLFELPKLMKP